MTTVTRLRGATGEEWYSWPVGAAAPALAAAAAGWSHDPAASQNVAEAITACDDWVGERGARLAGVWVPPTLGGVVAARWWAGVADSSTDEAFRSARRYQRVVGGRKSDGSATVFSQDIASLFVGDTEVVVVVETRGDGDGTELYIFARAVYFPLGTTDRVLLESVCPILDLYDQFTDQLPLMVSSLAFDLAEEA